MDAGDESFLPSFCNKRVLILGCGNRLFGDDGFGPAVTEFLSDRYAIPDDVYVMDAGTGVRKLLFTLTLDPRRPRQIFIIDAVEKGRTPGDIFEITPDELPSEKKDDFSLHQVPSSNLVRELTERGINVRVLVAQTGSVPDEVSPGLSTAVTEAIPGMCAWIAKAAGGFPAKEKMSYLRRS